MSLSIKCICLAAAAILPAHHLPNKGSAPDETSLTAVSDEVLACEADCGHHPAPEVVLTFCGECRGGGCDPGQNSWSLSSLDVPPDWPSIPLRPIKLEVVVPAGTFKFVELFLDNRPLAPNEYSTESPLTYQLPCPAPGRHVLQARYLAADTKTWSSFSRPLRFEVRLPKRPQIIAISDGRRDPTVPVGSGMALIRSDKIRVNLANVGPGEPIATYIDDQPISLHAADESCCLIFSVKGYITPGVHTLTVRNVGCPDACSITSKPSNEIRFHYYEEDVYLLRPGSGCDNLAQSGTSCRRAAGEEGIPDTDESREDDQPAEPELAPPQSQLPSPLTSVQELSRFSADGEFAGAVPPRFNRPRDSFFLLAAASSAAAEVAADMPTHPAHVAAVADRTAANRARIEAVKSAQQAAEQAAMAETAATLAESAARIARTNVTDVTAAIETANKARLDAQAAVERAKEAQEQATEYASDQRRRGNVEQAKVARMAAERAQDSLGQARKQAKAASDAYQAAQRHKPPEAIRALAASVAMAEMHAQTAGDSATKARQRAQAAADARDQAAESFAAARLAAQQVSEALKKNDSNGVSASGEAATIAKNRAVNSARDAATHLAEVSKHVIDVHESVRMANEAINGVNGFAQATKQAEQARIAATDRANNARYHASVGKDAVGELQHKLEAAWDYAEVAARQEALRARIERASKSKNDVDVQRAKDWANATAIRASRDEAKAEARMKTAIGEHRVATASAHANIVTGELNAKTALAKRVKGPSSPFYFASAAHFPLPSFGPRGRRLDRDGLLIYEDMKFSFDRDGNYEVHFRATTPEMPTTVKLQFQIQPCRGGPWYTVTLAPIQFEYSPSDNAQHQLTACTGNDCNDSGHPCDGKNECCGKLRECVCRGHSEILRRCYAEMGEDARIRRHGTARFGFGVEVP